MNVITGTSATLTILEGSSCYSVKDSIQDSINALYEMKAMNFKQAIDFLTAKFPDENALDVVIQPNDNGMYTVEVNRQISIGTYTIKLLKQITKKEALELYWNLQLGKQQEQHDER